MIFKMKKLFLSLLLASGFSAFSQASGTVQTTHVLIQDMVRSTVNEEWIFIDKVERNPYPYNWQFDIAKDGTGVAVANDLKTGNRFTFVVKSIENKSPSEGQMVFLQSLEIATNESCTIIVHKINGYHVISVMMPGTKTALFFDNLPQVSGKQF